MLWPYPQDMLIKKPNQLFHRVLRIKSCRPVNSDVLSAHAIQILSTSAQDFNQIMSVFIQLAHPDARYLAQIVFGLRTQPHQFQ